MTTFTVPEVPGSSKSSNARIYTHAIIGRFDCEVQIALAREREKLYHNHWDWQRAKANGFSGHLNLSSYDRQLAAAFINKNPSREAYASAQVNQEVKAIIAEHGEFGKGRFAVLRWCSSESCAERAKKDVSRGFVDVRVVQCVELKATTNEPFQSSAKANE